MTEMERSILDRLDTIEEVLKVLLVNNVLDDTETLAKQSKKHSSQKETKKEKEYREKCETLEQTVRTKEERISSLQNQLETQKKRVQNLQQLVDSKERTIQLKEERIQGFQKQIADHEAAVQNPNAHKLIEKQWKLVSSTNQEFVLDAYNSQNGTPICVNQISDGMNQLFTIEHHADNYFVIKNIGTGKVLDLNYGKITVGGKIQLWDFNGTDAQLWKLEDSGSDGFMIRSKLNEYYCIGIPFHRSGCNIVLCKSSDLYYTKLFRFSSPDTMKKPIHTTISFNIGQKVKLRPECEFCYDDAQSLKRLQISSKLYSPTSYTYTIKEKNGQRYYLHTKNDWGQKFTLWVDADMVIPV